MPTPIGHSLAGYAAAKLTRVELTRDERRFFVIAAAFGILPDVISLVLMRLVGEPDHGFSHSLLALAIVSLAAAALATRRGFRFWPVLLVVAAAYGSHLFADLLRPEPTADAGEQLLWPWHMAYAFDIRIFPHVPSRGESPNLLRWGWVVLPIMLREFVILAPIAALARFIPPARHRAPVERGRPRAQLASRHDAQPDRPGE